MLTARITQAIQNAAELIASTAVRNMTCDRRLEEIGRLPEPVLLEWTKAMLATTVEWLRSGDMEPLAPRFQKFGQARLEQNIPLAELMETLHIWRVGTVTYARGLGFYDNTLAIYTEEEFEHELTRLYDFVTYHVVKGYEAARESRPQPAAESVRRH